MDKADELASIAIQLASRVRDDDPEAVHRWLESVVDPADWMSLTIVLACAIPEDRTWKQLTAWTWVRHLAPRKLQPCGTPAALRRHHARHEPACDACKAVDRERKRESRKSNRSHPQPVDGDDLTYPQAVNLLSTDEVAEELPPPYGSAA